MSNKKRKTIKEQVEEPGKLEEQMKTELRRSEHC